GSSRRRPRIGPTAKGERPLAEDPSAEVGQPGGVEPEGPLAVESGVDRPAVADLPRQGYRQGAVGLGSQAGHHHRQGRERLAGAEAGMGGGPQRVESGGGQILRERRGGGADGRAAAGGVDAMAGGTVL